MSQEAYAQAVLTVRVLGDVEPAEDHDCFLAQDPAMRLVASMFRVGQPDETDSRQNTETPQHIL